MADRSALIHYIVDHQTSLIQVDFLKELWMIPDRMVATDYKEVGSDIHVTIQTESPLYPHKLFVLDKAFFSIVSFERTDDHSSDVKIYAVVCKSTGIVYNHKENEPLCTPQDTFILQAGDIANYTGNDVETTIGIFAANYMFLVYPFGAKIDYYNDEFTTSKLEKMIAIPLIKNELTIEEVKDKYINTLTLIGQSNEMICPNISEKTITIPESITKLREKLVAEHKDALAANDASVMSDIEKQLIKAYRDYLQGDPSLHFLLKKKYFDVTLKKLFLTQGMTEVFGSPGEFVFIDNPMGNGWKQKDLPAIFNEVRKGSYSRAVETANGGVIAKLILRVLQDTRIATDDCHTTRGEHVHGTKDALRDFMWNYIVASDGENTMITEDNMASYVGKDIVVRTPGYCEASLGFCARCFGYLFEQLGTKAFAPIANDFSRNQTTNSLKAMHGKSHNLVEISDINRYLV